MGFKSVFLLTFLLVPFIGAQSLDLDLEDPNDLSVLDPDDDDSIELAEEDMSLLDDADEAILSDDELGLDQTWEDLTLPPPPQIEDSASEGEIADELQSLEDEFEMMTDEEEKKPEKKDESVKASEIADSLEQDDKEKSLNSDKLKVVKDEEIASFDVGAEERALLEIAKNMSGRIPDEQWNDIVVASAETKHVVQEGEWLWKISEKYFGSGFYYSKVWSLNPYITNPHEIEPGMVLLFNTGDANTAPQVTLSQISQKNLQKNTARKDTGNMSSFYEQWGYKSMPPWLAEREVLIEEGTYINPITDQTVDDLEKMASSNEVKDYEVYEPPLLDFEIVSPKDTYGELGLDSSLVIPMSFKEGFNLNTFITTNIVQDFGKVESAINEKQYFGQYDRMYVRFDERIDLIIGDLFSIYRAEGEVTHPNSDREGFRYTILGSIKIIARHSDVWEVEIIDSVEPIKRTDRVTVYTPSLERIVKTFNSQIIESVIMDSYKEDAEIISYGDVVYLDRGRADGVTMGNVFEVYGFKDRGTSKNITKNPTYKTGELTVINVTDNFSTALVTSTILHFYRGDLAITKSKQAAMLATKGKEKQDLKGMSSGDLDELDVSLELDEFSENLLKQADKIKFTESELEELERQEREKSILTDAEKDLRELEKIEEDLELAESMIDESKKDEDKILEAQSLNALEKDFDVGEMESIDEIEETFGKKYLDEDLNKKENPYGLTEYDIEEVDELLNVDKNEDPAESLRSESIELESSENNNQQL